jgi:glycosyltransferase involved in cell wall biosynthesis
MFKIVHLVPHLGGGIGKALSGIVSKNIKTKKASEHTFICLELLEKEYFAKKIVQDGARIVFPGSISETRDLINAADVFQIEWWNHPATIKALIEINQINTRIITWCHQSGLINPVIPDSVFALSDYIAYTSECSLERINTEKAKRHGCQEVVISSATCDSMEIFQRNNQQRSKLEFGYIGSTNYAKLHPEYIDWIAKVDLHAFKVYMYGDAVNKNELQKKTVALKKTNLIEFKGYTESIEKVLSGLDVLIYLLNPRHYGTAENVLIEAMAMGVVPIVLNNPAETAIVKHLETGVIVEKQEDLAYYINLLSTDRKLKNSLSKNASEDVRRRFRVESMVSNFDFLYEQSVNKEKTSKKFADCFYQKPYENFLATQEKKNIYEETGLLSVSELKNIPDDALEITKGSPFHYNKYFPEDRVIRNWCDCLSKLREEKNGFV